MNAFLFLTYSDLLNQAKLKKEKHSYSIEEFGLNEAKVKDSFKNYMMNYEF